MRSIPSTIQLLVAEAIVNQPSKSYVEIGREFGISEWMVAKIAVKFSVRRPYGKRSPAWLLNRSKLAVARG